MKPVIYSPKLKNYLEKIGKLTEATKLLYRINPFRSRIKQFEIGNNPIKLYRETEPEFAQLYNLSGEKEVLFDLVGSLEEDDVFYDIGANIGLYTCSVASEVPEIEVFSFEPLDINYERLKQNCELNNLENVEIINKGVGKQSTTEKIYVDPEFGHQSGIGRNSFLKEPYHQESVEVEMLAARKLLDHYPKPTIIKIDVEGMEKELCEELEYLFNLDCLKRVYIEFHPKKKSFQNSDKESVKNILEANGFEVSWIDDKGGSHPYMRGLK